jgi:predicted dehydrogenase
VAEFGRDAGVESWGCAILSFEDGSRGVAYGSDAMLGGMQSKLQVLAGDHHLECSLSPHDLVRAFAPADGTFGDAYLMEKLDTQAGWSTPLPDEDWSSGQQGLCQAVAVAAAEGRASEADGALGLDVTRVVYAAYLSASEGRRVSLEEDAK